MYFNQIGEVVEFDRAQQRGRVRFPSGSELRFKVNELRHSPRAVVPGAPVSDVLDEPGFDVGSRIKCLCEDEFEIQ